MVEKSIVRFKMIGTIDRAQKCCTIKPGEESLKDRIVKFDIRVWLSEGCVDWTHLVTKEMCRNCYQELYAGALLQEPETD